MAKSNKRRTKNKNLSRPAKELTTDEQQQVKGGLQGTGGLAQTTSQAGAGGFGTKATDILGKVSEVLLATPKPQDPPKPK